MSFFDIIETLPEDPIFSLQATFQADVRKKKINLGIGAYKDATGNSIVLTCVQKAEKQILEESLYKDYLPIAGEKNYILETAKLIFGDTQKKLVDESIFGAQTIGGTSALRIGAELFLQDNSKTIYLPNLTWANHKLIFHRTGLKVDFYPYYNNIRHELDFAEMCHKLKGMNQGDVVVLHGTPHNPTGINPNMDQWKELSSLIKSKNLIPFFDIAYQGFGVGLNEDMTPLRYFVEQGHEMLIAYTYSKNMGLYGERVGAIFAVSEKKEGAIRAGSHIKQIIRSIYSNPPLQGARIVERVLKEDSLKTEWIHELNSMKERVNEMRKAFVTGLLSKSQDTHYQFLNQNQTGLFIYTGLNHDQTHRLRQDFGIYVPDGRINLAGLNSNNMNYVIESILSV